MTQKARSRATAAPAGGRRERGFALLIVLWTLVLLALIVTAIGASGRTQSRIARNLMANAQAEAAADGAVEQAIFRLANAGEQAWTAQTAPPRIMVGAIPVALSVEEQAGKINPNAASPDLLRALLAAAGANAAQAQAVAQAIVEWRGGATPGEQAAIVARYLAAGRSYQPAFAPFESLDDVGLVLGMDRDLMARLRPHLSLQQIGTPDPSLADPVVRKALGAQAANNAPPPLAVAYRSVAIQATALGPGDARFTRRAVVRIGPGLPRGYAMQAWEAPGTQ